MPSDVLIISDELFNSSFYSKEFLSQRNVSAETKVENRKEKENTQSDEKIQVSLSTFYNLKSYLFSFKGH